MIELHDKREGWTQKAEKWLGAGLVSGRRQRSIYLNSQGNCLGGRPEKKGLSMSGVPELCSHTNLQACG